MVWLVLMCSRTRHSNVSFALPWSMAVVFGFLFQSVTTEFGRRISRALGVLMSLGRKNGQCEDSKNTERDSNDTGRFLIFTIHIRGKHIGKREATSFVTDVRRHICVLLVEARSSAFSGGSVACLRTRSCTIFEAHLCF